MQRIFKIKTLHTSLLLQTLRFIFSKTIFVLCRKFPRFINMNYKIFTIIILFAASEISWCQPDTILNSTDKGQKTGTLDHKISNGNIRYEGSFQRWLPRGEFRRYYDDQNLNSIMVFTNKGKSRSKIFFPDGSPAACGKYINKGRRENGNSILQLYWVISLMRKNIPKI